MAKTRNTNEEHWHELLLHGDPAGRRMRPLFGRLPSNPRCKICNAPFRGVGGTLMRLAGRPQSRKNPRYCEPCEMTQAGGAEVEISMLFADVRGSTSLAESMSPMEFGRLIGQFYETATKVLVEGDALIDRLVGDEVIGLFIPGFAGQQHARQAVETAKKLLKQLGKVSQEGRRLPVGAGVHTGMAFVGLVKGSEEGLGDFTALGDSVNVAARLASQATAGEILISGASCLQAGIDTGKLEHRQLQLKGRSVQIGVYSLRVEGSPG